MFEVDARGLSCPEPVMLTLAAVREHKGETIRVLVNEAHTRHNVEKAAKTQGRKVNVKETGTDYELILEP